MIDNYENKISFRIIAKTIRCDFLKSQDERLERLLLASLIAIRLSNEKMSFDNLSTFSTLEKLYSVYKKNKDNESKDLSYIKNYLSLDLGYNLTEPVKLQKEEVLEQHGHFYMQIVRFYHSMDMLNDFFKF